jgi:hypothetical protein
MGRAADYRTEQVGWHLANKIAFLVAEALVHLSRERRILDGFAARGDSAGRGTGDTSTTEAAATASLEFGRDAEDIKDAIDGVEIAVKHLGKLSADALGKIAPLDTPRCKEGQRGRDAIKWSDDEQCTELPVKMDMCNKHYMAYYRFRVANHLPVTQYFEDA